MQFLQQMCLVVFGALHFQTKTVPDPQVLDAALLVERKAAVVKVTTATGTGSGFLVRSDGTVLTAYHVIAGADSIWIHLPSGKALQATGVTELHPEKDVAVLKLPPEVVAGIVPIPLASSTPESPSAVEKGAAVSVLGYPGGNGLTVADGTCLLTRRSPNGLAHHVINATVIPGFSGGPLLNRAGQAVGIAVVGSQKSELSEAVDIGASMPLPPTSAAITDVSEANKAYEDSAEYAFSTGYNVLLYWRDEEGKKKLPADALEWALSRFTLACTKRPDFSLALNNKAYCEVRLKRYDKAEKSYREAIKICPEDLMGRYSLATLYTRMGRDDDALREIKAVLKMSPHFAAAYAMLGEQLQVKSDSSGAAEALESAVKLKPQNETYRIELARLYIEMRKSAKALALLKSVAEQRPDSFDAYYLTGLAYADMLKHRDAINAQIRAIHINQKHADARFQLACEYVMVGDLEKARGQYKALLGLDARLAARLLALLKHN